MGQARGLDGRKDWVGHARARGEGPRSGAGTFSGEEGARGIGPMGRIGPIPGLRCACATSRPGASTVRAQCEPRRPEPGGQSRWSTRMLSVPSAFYRWKHASILASRLCSAKSRTRLVWHYVPAQAAQSAADEPERRVACVDSAPALPYTGALCTKIRPLLRCTRAQDLLF